MKTDRELSEIENPKTNLSLPCLVLNKGRSAVRVQSVKKSIIKVSNEKAMILDPETSILHNWEEWVGNFSYLNEDVTDFNCIEAKDIKIKVPEIIVLTKYNKLPKFSIVLNRRNLLIRDGLIDQYTGKKISSKDATIDHILPRCRGGKTTWDNCVICHYTVNMKKADRTPEEAGLKLIRPPSKPRWDPIYSFFVRNMPDSWKMYINTNSWNEFGYWDVPLID